MGCSVLDRGGSVFEKEKWMEMEREESGRFGGGSFMDEHRDSDGWNLKFSKLKTLLRPKRAKSPDPISRLKNVEPNVGGQDDDQKYAFYVVGDAFFRARGGRGRDT